MAAWAERDKVTRCRVIGAAIGIVVFLWLLFVSGLSFLAAVFLAVVTGGFSGGLLIWATCEGRGGATEDAELLTADWAPEEFPDAAAINPRIGAGADQAGAAARHDATRAAPHERPGPAADESRPPPGVAELEESAGAAAPDADAEAGRHRGAAAGRIEPLKRRGTEAEDAGAEVVPEAGPGPISDSDLTRIKGIGPRLVALLNENGVTEVTQIAGWSDADVDRHEQLLGRIGYRVRSDNWVEQARSLASGTPGAETGAADGAGDRSGR